MANIYNNIPEMLKNEFEKPEQPDYQGVVSSLNKEHNLSDDKGFKLAKTDDPAYKGVNILHPTGRGMTPNELEWAMKNKSLKGYQENANAREEAMRKSLGKTDKPQDEKYMEDDNEEWEVYDKEGNLYSKVKGFNNMIEDLKKIKSQPKETQPQYDFDVNDEDSIFDAWEQGKIDEKTRDKLNSERQRRLVGHDFDIGYSKYPIGEEDYRISEALDDSSWAITPRDTVDTYSKFIAEKMGIPQQKVLEVMEKEAGRKLSLTEDMFRLRGMVSEEDYEENENRYPKGTSKDYTEQVNQEYQKALPILAKYGIKPEDFGGRENEYGGFEDNSREILDKYVFNPFQQKYPRGNNEVWERDYKPLYEAINSVLDKNYNDWWIKKAPMGY